MGKFRTEHYFLIFFFTGFLLGILFMNYGIKKDVAATGIYTEAFLQKLTTTQIVSQKYLWYLLRARTGLLGILVLMTFLRIRRLAAAAFTIWTGLAGGMLLSEAVVELGMKGSILCLTSILPQSLFYIPVILVFLRHIWNYPQNQWNRQKTLFVSVLSGFGILSELYLNPWLIQRVASFVL